MDPLATQADVEARLGRELTFAEAARIVAVLADASSAVRNYTGQQFTEGTGTVRLRTRRGKVRLPQRPVTAVASVKNTAGSLLLFSWDGGDVVTADGGVPDTFAWEPFSTDTHFLDVDYTHGYDVIPDDIIGVVCSIAVRVIGRVPEDAGLTSESIQGYSYSIGSAAAAGGFGMLADERMILDGYRRTGGFVQVGP